MNKPPFKKTSATKSSSGDIKKILATETPPHAVLVLCPDRVRRERAVDSILSKISSTEGLSQKDIKAAQTKIDCGEISPDSLRLLKENISSLSLFSPVRIFLFVQTEELSAKVNDEIIKIIKEPTDRTYLVFTGTSLPITSKIVKTFNALEKGIILEAPSNSEVLKWAQKEARNLKIECEEDLLSALVTISENESLVEELPILDIVHSKLTRLSLYLCDEKPTHETLANLFPESFNASEFDFVDEAILGNIAKSEPMLSVLLDNGKNPFLLLSLFSRSLTNTILVRYLLEKGHSQEQIRTELGINPWILGKVMRVAKAVPLTKLLKAAREILKIDSRLKGNSLDELHLFSSMIQEIH